MTDQLLGIFKFALLALLYLFFARVLWAVWSEVRPAKVTPAHAEPRVAATPVDPTAPLAAPAPRNQARREVTPVKPTKGRRGAVGRVVVMEPRARRGAAYATAGELTIGRAETCSIGLADDTFASQLHARLFVRDGGVWVEDLGSTNGTFVNGRRIAGADQLSKGDRLQVGNTVFEAQ